MIGLRQCVSLLIAAIFAISATASLAQDSKKPGKPKTRVTEKLSPKVYEQIVAAQSALEARDYKAAESIMNGLKATSDTLNNYEKAQMHNFLAAIHYEQGNTQATIKDYQAILALEGVPEQIRNNSLFRLAQLYFVSEQYAKSIQLLDDWMNQVASVRPEAYMLKAQAFYQQGKYQQAEAPIILALREARRRQQAPSENWLALLRAVYYEKGEYSKAAKVLESLIKSAPKPSYYTQLAGMYGLMKQQKKQLYVMHAAKAAGMLENESDILNMARLYMAEDAPFPAIELIQEGFDAGTVQENASNLQLLAQAMSLARETEAQIPVLEKAAAMSNDAQQFMYLGQAQLALYQWQDAASSLERALAMGGLDRQGGIYMQIGTAYYNLKRYGPALQAFKNAGRFAAFKKQSSQWVKFVQMEIQHQKVVSGV